MNESLGQSEQTVTHQTSFKPSCKDAGRSRVSRNVPGGQAWTLQPGWDGVHLRRRRGVVLLSPWRHKKESTRGLFFSHTRQEWLFLRSILRIKMQKNTYKTKNKAKGKDYILDDEKCWVTMRWIHDIYFSFHVKLIWTGRALNKRWTLSNCPGHYFSTLYLSIYNIFPYFLYILNICLDVVTFFCSKEVCCAVRSKQEAGSAVYTSIPSDVFTFLSI